MTPSGLSVRHLPLAKPRPCRKSGTDGSNPVPSTGESANFQSLSGRCVSPATAMTWSSTARGALAIPATPKVAMATAGPMVGACLMALLAALRNSELLQGASLTPPASRPCGGLRACERDLPAASTARGYGRTCRMRPVPLRLPCSARPQPLRPARFGRGPQRASDKGAQNRGETVLLVARCRLHQRIRQRNTGLAP